MTLYLGPSSVSVTSSLAIGVFLGISVPVGYDSKRVPIGICSGRLKGSKPKLIEIAYCFKQATKNRKPPSFEPSDEAKNSRQLINSSKLTSSKLG